MPAGGISGSPFNTILGRPLIPIEQASTLGTVGDLVLADLSQYVIIEKDGLQAASSMHVRFIYDEMTFKFTMRVNGQPKLKSAITPANGTNTQSPFVALATRA
jgi:HK97 family phage major capsid protein